MHVLVVGTIGLDTIETPFGSVQGALGGSATYIALAAKYFTSRVGLVAVVGGDLPDEYRCVFDDASLNTDGVQVIPDGKTFAWGGRYHYDLNERETLFTDLNVLSSFRPDVPRPFRSKGIVCLGNLSPEVQLEVLNQVAEPDLVLCDTMNYWIENSAPTLRRLLRRVDVLIVNDAEARELAGVANLVKAARIIRALGPRILIIKKGEHGALLFYEEQIFSAPAYPLEDIQDPTGAGDAFMGGLAGYLAHNRTIDEDTLRRGVIVGSAMASFAVEQFGPSRLLGVAPEEIWKRVEAFRILAHIPSYKLDIVQ